jgi:hypothetical protein
MLILSDWRAFVESKVVHASADAARFVQLVAWSRAVGRAWPHDEYQNPLRVHMYTCTHVHAHAPAIQCGTVGAAHVVVTVVGTEACTILCHVSTAVQGVATCARHRTTQC